MTQPAIKIVGPDPFACGADGKKETRVGTAFPSLRTLVTTPGIHATQRMDLIEHLNRERGAAGLPALTAAEDERLLQEAVDLVFEECQILIRPDPARMDLAFEADEMLDDLRLVSRRNVRFLFAMDPRVRAALCARGENWRISPLPQKAADMCALIAASRAAIREGAIYYYNWYTGTRLLTYQEFKGLGKLDDAALARQLREIAVYSAQLNRKRSPEVDFFPPGPSGFGARDFQGIDFAGLEPAALREAFEGLGRRFHDAVEPDFWRDDPSSEVWRNRMLSALVSQHDKTITVDLLRELSPEFFMQVEWLPGGRFEEGEFILDPVFEERAGGPKTAGFRPFCDPLVRGFIFSYIREYGALEYINIGRIGHSLSSVRPQERGRRGVYLAQLKVPGLPEPVLRLIRLQKWGIAEHLDEGKPLLQAFLENEEYTDYVLDRGLGLRQLGMNLPARYRVLRTQETYSGPNREVSGQTIPVVCFERGYLSGLATDKVPPSRYLKEGYAEQLGALLGKAAASNIIVGRAREGGLQAMFDDGDEIVLEDPLTGLPSEIVVGDPTGSFVDYRRSLLEMAGDYARPVTLREGKVPRLPAFAEAYLRAFRERFGQLQGDYRKRTRAFDSLFKHCRYDPAGSFAFRWERVLRRLNETDADALVLALRRHIGALKQTEGA